MAWLARAIGQLGENAGEAHEIGLDWREREARMRGEAQDRQLRALMAPYELQRLMAEVKQMTAPKPAGIITTPSGGTAGITFTPGSGFSSQTLIPGLSKETAKAEIKNYAASVPASHQSYFDALTKSLDYEGTDPQAVVQEADRYAARLGAEGTTRFPKALGTIPYGVSDPNTGVDYWADEQGRLHGPDNGPAPKELQNLYTAAYRGYQQRLQDTYDKLAKTEGFTRAQQERAFDERRRLQAIKAGQDAVLAQNRLADAEGAAKTPSNQGDLLIIENFMQLAFGQQPRGIRGSPQWFERMETISRGSMTDRLVGWEKSLSGGGLLANDARAQVLDQIRMLVKNRVTAATMMSGAYAPGFNYGVPAFPGINFPDETQTPGTNLDQELDKAFGPAKPVGKP